MGNSPEFGSMLRTLRLKAQITQEELAERAGLSARAISGLERGNVRRPQRNTVILLARALGLKGAVANDFIEIARGRPKHFDLELSARDEGDEQDVILHTVREPDLAVGVLTAPPEPAHLPRDVQGFLGRETELAQLKSYVEVASDDAVSHCPVIVVISGMLGVGKTALAVRLAHELSQRFPDGQLFLDVMGDRPEQAVGWRAAMKTILTSFGVTDEELPSDERVMLETYRRMTTGRRFILVLDNAADENQIRPLLPTSSSCLVIITIRKRPTSLVVTEGAKAVVLRPLPEVAATNLILGIVGQRSEPEAARYLAKVSGSLPLALRIVASKAVMEPNKSLSALAQELEDPVACLELSAALPQRPLRLRGLFADSYDTLSPDLARALRTLGLAFTDEFSSTALASMMEVDPEVARSMLERMADLCVVEQTPLAGKFRIHPLWHAYARTVAKEEETPETQAQVVQRLLRYYLQETAGATRKLWRAWPGLPENEMCCVSDIDDARAGKKWLDGEQTNLYIAVCVALECGEYDIAWRLALLCGSFLSLRRRWLEWIRMLRNGLSAARRANNPVAEVDVLAALGFAYLEIKHFQRAADCFGEALTKGNCGSDEIRSCLLRLGLQASSFGHVSPLTGDQPVVATQRGLRGSGGLVLLGMGYLYRQVRLFGAAESYARMVVKAFKETGCRVGEAVALMELGRVLQADGQLLESISCFESALHIWRDLEESLAQGECLLAMGDWWYAAGQVKEAEAAWVRALPLFGACDDNLAMITHARLRQLQANDPDSPGCAVPKSWVPRQAAEK